MQDDINMMLEMSQKLIDDAREFLDAIKDAHDATAADSTRLEQAVEDLTEYIDDMSAANEELRPLVDEATAHAMGLRDQAQNLAEWVQSGKIF